MTACNITDEFDLKQLVNDFIDDIEYVKIEDNRDLTMKILEQLSTK